MDLLKERHIAAEAAFQACVFHPGVAVEDTCGWEYTVPGAEMTRKLFVRFDVDAASDAANLAIDEPCTVLATFTVVFAHRRSAQPVGAFAILASNGEDVGAMPASWLDALPTGPAARRAPAASDTPVASGPAE